MKRIRDVVVGFVAMAIYALLFKCGGWRPE